MLYQKFTVINVMDIPCSRQLPLLRTGLPSHAKEFSRICDKLATPASAKMKDWIEATFSN